MKCDQKKRRQPKALAKRNWEKKDRQRQVSSLKTKGNELNGREYEREYEREREWEKEWGSVVRSPTVSE